MFTTVRKSANSEFNQSQNFFINVNRSLLLYFFKVLLDVIFKNENKSEEMLDILKEIRGYSPDLEDEEQKLKCRSIFIVGDQLTVERGVNVIKAVQNAFTPEDMLSLLDVFSQYHWLVALEGKKSSEIAAVPSTIYKEHGSPYVL